MARYAKPKRPPRTEQRGLRPYSGTGAEYFSAREVQKMGERIQRILANSSPHSEEEKFLLNQARFVCLFMQARGNDLKRNKLFREINRGERIGQQLGFSQEDLLFLNLWVLDQDQTGKLETLGQKLRQKVERIA